MNVVKQRRGMNQRRDRKASEIAGGMERESEHAQGRTEEAKNEGLGLQGFAHTTLCVSRWPTYSLAMRLDQSTQAAHL